MKSKNYTYWAFWLLFVSWSRVRFLTAPVFITCRLLCSACNISQVAHVSFSGSFGVADRFHEVAAASSLATSFPGSPIDVRGRRVRPTFALLRTRCVLILSRLPVLYVYIHPPYIHISHLSTSMSPRIRVSYLVEKAKKAIDVWVNG